MHLFSVTKRSELNSIYRIANVSVDPQVNVIVRDEQTIRIEPKAMELLNYLVSHQGHVCGKAEIQAAVWPNQVVADEALTRLIFVLRSALKDDAKAPIFISTIPKKGYVFLVEPRQEIASAGQLIKNKKWMTLSGLAIFIFLSILIFLDVETKREFQLLREVPVTYTDGLEFEYRQNKETAVYFHHNDDQTSVVYRAEDGQEKVLVSDNWQKRGILLLDSAIFYIRYKTNMYQIVWQKFDGSFDVLFESQTPLYSLSYNPESKGLLFNQYLNNESTVLKEYSFVERNTQLFEIQNAALEKRIFLHFFNRDNGYLTYVAVDGQKPQINIVNKEKRSFSYSGFDKVNSITQGQREQDLLIAGKIGFTNGIWHLDTITQNLTFLYNVPSNDVTDTFYDFENQQLYLSLQGQRADLLTKSLSGAESQFPYLNSTQVESVAQFQTSDSLYFASNRTGDYELYHYDLRSQSTRQISNLAANDIWYFAVANDGSQVAVVYSKEQILLGIVDLENGELKRAIVLEELKFPLGWSADNEYVFVSEHLRNIAMYRYKANNLEVVDKKVHLGLTAVELSPGEIIAFDYQTEKFVSYDFNTDKLKELSKEVRLPMTLSPRLARVNTSTALVSYEDDMEKRVYRYDLSEDRQLQEETLVSQMRLSGDIRGFSPDLQSLVISKDNKNQGDIVRLTLELVEQN